MSTPRPVLLRADNFTPPTRTPWGGTRLFHAYKQRHLGAVSEPVIGESWEVSVEPDFPARLEDGRSLSAYIAEAPHEVLGGEAARSREGTALLVKLIDSAEPLSVQIHPDDAYPGLAEGECGKPESWYVVEREPGAGLYLGFRRGTSEADVRSALLAGDSLESLLRFVPVEPGDFFLIDAGTPHAIGAGLTLVEPQHVVPGKRGVTYRYWDWNRRYDARGRPDSFGSTRPLHVEHALRVTSWERVQREDFVDEIRLRSGAVAVDGAARATSLAGASGLPSSWLHVTRVAGTGALTLAPRDRLLGVTVLAGTLRVGDLSIERGRSAVVPACWGALELELEATHALVCSVA